MKDLGKKKDDSKALLVKHRRANPDISQSPETNDLFLIHRQATCACGGDCPRCQTQSTLPVSKPSDAAEIEADSIADKVLRMQKPEFLHISYSRNMTSKKNDNETPEAEVNDSEETKADKSLYRKQTDRKSDSTVSSSLVRQALTTSGKAMETKTREFMESRFNRNFEKVRIHDNVLAAESAAAIDAQAYTSGDDIVFSAGQYKPETEGGKRLLAHELTHVVQQNDKIHRQSQPPTSIEEEKKSGKEFNAASTNEPKSFDSLLASFDFILNKISSLNEPEMTQDEFRVAHEKDSHSGKAGFFGNYSYYKFLIRSLEMLYSEMQSIIQKEMEKIYKELAGSGESETLPKVFLLLKKFDDNLLRKEIQSGEEVKADWTNKETTNQRNVDNGLLHKELKDVTEGNRFYNPKLLQTNITRSEFTEKGGRQFDYFDQSANRPFVNIEYYDKEQKVGKEIYLFIAEIHRIRYRQLSFIKEFYGIDEKGKKIAGAYIPSVFMPTSKQFDLFSLDDWREFLSNRFDYLVNIEKKNRAEAFMTIIRILESYVKTFTIHTPYNIEETGDNYLTKNFPKALTGQLIQDCGVYALKVVYLLSLLSPKLKLKIQYILFPNHIGLIIQSDDTPTLIVHNENFFPIPLSEAQFYSLSKENQRMIISEKKLVLYEQDKQQGNPQRIHFTMEHLKQDWIFESIEGKLNPQTDEQFMAETAAKYFIRQTDIPFKTIDIGQSQYDPKLPADKIKLNLWEQYNKMMRETALFDETVLKRKESETYQFNLWYLKITDATKAFYNNVVISFWNIEARDKWKKLSESLAKSKDNKNEAEYLKALEDYLNNFNTRLSEIEKRFDDSIGEVKNFIHRVIAKKSPTPINRGTQTTLMERSYQESWRVALNEHREAVETRIKNLKNKKETMNGGTDITPPFAGEKDKLPYIP